jgi:hypothetical protein
MKQARREVCRLVPVFSGCVQRESQNVMRVVDFNRATLS